MFSSTSEPSRDQCLLSLLGEKKKKYGPKKYNQGTLYSEVT